MRKVNKFEHTRQQEERRQNDNIKKMALAEKLKNLLVGFSDEEIAILFPHLKGGLDELHKHKAAE